MLKAWLYQHIKNPYPTKAEKIMLAVITKMTLTQISTWFANARRRIKKDHRTHLTSTQDRSKTDSQDEDDVDSVVMETRRNDIRLASCNDVIDNVIVNVGKGSGSYTINNNNNNNDKLRGRRVRPTRYASARLQEPKFIGLYSLPWHC